MFLMYHIQKDVQKGSKLECGAWRNLVAFRSHHIHSCNMMMMAVCSMEGSEEEDWYEKFVVLAILGCVMSPNLSALIYLDLSRLSFLSLQTNLPDQRNRI